MPIVSKETLKGYFNKGDVPTESNYIDLIDSLGGGDMFKSEYDVADNGIVDDADKVSAWGLGSPAVQAITDWDNYKTTGFFVGNTLTNSPYAGWVYVLVIGYNSTYVVQLAVQFITATQPYTWIRRCIGGTWDAWKTIWPALWSDIASKPSTYPPSSHTHLGTDITSQVADAVNAAYATNAGYATSAGDADTVDSIHGSSFVRSDANDTKTGALNMSNNGLTMGSTSSYAGQGQIALIAGNLISRPASTSYDVYAFHPLVNYVASATYSGGGFSTFGKTGKTISTEFSGVPAEAKALLLNVSIRDSASAANECWFMSSPNSSAGDGITVRCSGLANDKWSSHAVTVPTNGSGTIYFQAQASGTGTLDVSIRCWGYWV